MGKKKKASKKSTTGGIRNHDSFDGEVADVLASILERTDSKRPADVLVENRLDLCSSLKNFVAILEKRAKITITKNDHIKEDFWLLQVERMARKVRTNCDKLMISLPREREEVYLLNQRLENISKNYTGPKVEKSTGVYAMQVTILGRSLLSKYLGQLQMEECIVEEALSFLLHMYGNTDNDLSSLSPNGRTQSDIVLLRKWVHGIEEQIGLDPMQWNNLASIFMQMQIKQDEKLESIKAGNKDVPNITNDLEPATNEMIKVECPAECAFMISPTSVANEDGMFKNAKSAGKIVEIFLQGIDQRRDTSVAHFVLLVGDSGNGKTYICDEVEKRVTDFNASIGKNCCRITRPSLPTELTSKTLGETEDIILSMLMGCARNASKCILILDDVQHLLGNTYEAISKDINADIIDSHTMLRSRSAFLSAIDYVKNSSAIRASPNFQLLVICTARNLGDETIHRFDTVFHLQNPDDNARKSIITSSFRLGEDLFLTNKEIKILLNEVISASLGKSHAELAQCCRETLGVVTIVKTLPANESERLNMLISDKIDLLHEMKRSLSSNSPESVRTGSLDDFVDMRVLTARELLTKAPPPLELPLFGKNAHQAWNQMESLIISPLCRAKALDDILFKDTSCVAEVGGSRMICGGVLLTGIPGSGKSALAYHCAKVAVSILPSLSFLDVSCTSLVHKEVGGSERALQRLFSAARAAAPCILLMDGIENIAGVRGHDTTTEGTMDRVLSTLLTELDGVDNGASRVGTSSGNRVAVIGITHNPALIDPALRRPGRLEKSVLLKSPDYHARQLITLREIERRRIIFSTNAAIDNFPTNNDELSSFLAKETSGMSAAEVVAVCNEACIVSSRRYVDANEQQVSSLTAPCMEVDDFIAALRFRKGGK